MVCEATPPSAYYYSIMSFTVDVSSVADSQTTETSHRIAPLSLRLSATRKTHIPKCLLVLRKQL